MIKLDNISKSYGSHKIIDGFSASFETGKTYCIMGRSGIGKTTFMRILSRLEKPDSGKAVYDGQPKFSFVFQENRLLDNISAEDNIRFVSKTADASLYLKKVGLDGSENQIAAKMSGGMKRRLAIARALSFGGDVFFIDEPVSGLDIKTAEDIVSLLKKELEGKTAFIITHSPEEAYRLADKIIYFSYSPISSAEIFDISEFSSPDDIAGRLK